MATSTVMGMHAFFLLASAVLVACQSVDPYPSQVAACASAYKSCANNGESACSECAKTCDDAPDIPNTPTLAVCTLLRDYCVFKGANPEVTCTDPNCVSYYEECLKNGPNDSSCGYCGTACKTCPDQAVVCNPENPAPTPPPGCGNGPCTYYNQLCKDSSSATFCSYCQLLCSDICDDENKFCSEQIMA